MDSSRLPDLVKAVRKVVRAASQPNGALEQGEFTQASARGEVARILKLGKGELDGPQWKGTVKEEVKKALEALNDGEDGEQPASPEASSSTARSPSLAQASVKNKTRAAPKLSKKKTSARSESRESEEEGKESAEVVEGDSGGESDMSSVYDAPTKRRKKDNEAKDEGKSGAKKGSKSTKKAKKDPNEGLSPDDARIADLKKLVVACGVRKQWTKEFEGIPSAKGQIAHLQGILRDLGMEGKPTMGKAKGIKEARELASELNDVKQFEAARGVSGEGRPKRSRGKANQSSRDEEEDGDEAEREGSEEDEPEEQGAADAVMAFLGGEESDSE